LSWGGIAPSAARESCRTCADTRRSTSRGVQQESTATGPDGSASRRTQRDGDLRGCTPVDGVPVVCKQGVRGSSPLSSTGQRHDSNSRGARTAAKYRNRDRGRCRPRVRVGFAPAGGCGLRCIDPRCWAGIGAAEQEELLRQSPAPLSGGQWATSRIRRFKAGSCRSCRGSANGKLLSPPTVRFLVTPHRFTARRTPNIYISPRVAVAALSSTDQPVRGGLSAIPYRRSCAAPPRFLPSRSWDATVPATGSRRGTCGLSWPGRADVTGTGDGGHGRESWFAVMLDL
jgi:hypothetical protein